MRASSIKKVREQQPDLLIANITQATEKVQCLFFCVESTRCSLCCNVRSELIHLLTHIVANQLCYAWPPVRLCKLYDKIQQKRHASDNNRSDKVHSLRRPPPLDSSAVNEIVYSCQPTSCWFTIVRTKKHHATRGTYIQGYWYIIRLPDCCSPNATSHWTTPDGIVTDIDNSVCYKYMHCAISSRAARVISLYLQYLLVPLFHLTTARTTRVAKWWVLKLTLFLPEYQSSRVIRNLKIWKFRW